MPAQAHNVCKHVGEEKGGAGDKLVAAHDHAHDNLLGRVAVAVVASAKHEACHAQHNHSQNPEEHLHAFLHGAHHSSGQQCKPRLLLHAPNPQAHDFLAGILREHGSRVAVLPLVDAALDVLKLVNDFVLSLEDFELEVDDCRASECCLARRLCRPDELALPIRADLRYPHHTVNLLVIQLRQKQLRDLGFLDEGLDVPGAAKPLVPQRLPEPDAHLGDELDAA
mmetsp:Transcript_74164/g.241165  ORF Transcript_74164/g.241165 Transcript_74164/m.241165 type:complete len:224 (+) Transcript_74164:1055-1726(+)